jgi:hypothetical protein
MPEALSEMPVPEGWTNPPRSPWTRKERDALARLGWLDGAGWELIEGQCISGLDIVFFAARFF